MKPTHILVATVMAFTLTACGNDDDKALSTPKAQEPIAADNGYFCNMAILNHEGSKGQIFLTNNDKPLWFSTIRDVFSYVNSPDEPQNISAIYVNDMAKASWASPEEGTWIKAEDAIYVIGSDRRNGMGGKSIVPFGDKAKAEEFISHYGGMIHNFNNIPKSYIFEAEAKNMQHKMHQQMPEMSGDMHGEMAHDMHE